MQAEAGKGSAPRKNQDQKAYRDWETHSIFDSAAPFIITLINTRTQKLIEQIAFATHNFHTVITCYFG